MNEISNLVSLVLVFMGVLSLHEAAHAYTALLLGDPTAKLEGRVTLNPLKHLDPMGTVVLFVTGFIGWGKPVPVNPRNFENPIRDSALVAFAGPLANFISAFITISAINYFPSFFVSLPWLLNFLILFFEFNLLLGCFNLLPLPPLDGSKVIGLFIPKKFHTKYEIFLEEGVKFFVIFLVFDALVLREFFGFSVIHRVVGGLVSILKALIYWGL
jgi:Zn-dependent protease